MWFKKKVHQKILKTKKVMMILPKWEKKHIFPPKSYMPGGATLSWPKPRQRVFTERSVVKARGGGGGNLTKIFRIKFSSNMHSETFSIFSILALWTIPVPLPVYRNRCAIAFRIVSTNNHAESFILLLFCCRQDQITQSVYGSPAGFG